MVICNHPVNVNSLKLVGLLALSSLCLSLSLSRYLSPNPDLRKVGGRIISLKQSGVSPCYHLKKHSLKTIS